MPGYQERQVPATGQTLILGSKRDKTQCVELLETGEAFMEESHDCNVCEKHQSDFSGKMSSYWGEQGRTK